MQGQLINTEGHTCTDTQRSQDNFLKKKNFIYISFLNLRSMTLCILNLTDTSFPVPADRLHKSGAYFSLF